MPETITTISNFINNTFQGVQLQIFTAFIAPIILAYIWKFAKDSKILVEGDLDKIEKRWPIIGVMIHDLVSEAKKTINPKDTDLLVNYVADKAKKAIKGPFDDVVIDMLVRKIVESRKH